MCAKFFPNYPLKDNIYGIGGFGSCGGMSFGVSCGESELRTTDTEVEANKNSNEARVDPGNNDSKYLNLGEINNRIDNQAKGQVGYNWGPLGGWACFGGYSGPSIPESGMRDKE